MDDTSIIRCYVDLRKIFDETLKLKNGPLDQRNNERMIEKRKYASLLFVLIKKLNRTVKYRVRSGREKLHQAKLQVDSNRLHLQNLLYEANHLKREVRYCHQFKSQDEEIDLLSEQEYLSSCASDTSLALATPHVKRLGRLECELNLRKQLSSYYNELLNSKKDVVQDIVLKVERLTSFTPSLQQLIEATKPLQEALQIPMDSEWKLSQLVQLLPKPLYLAYMNIHALQVASDIDVAVTIVGVEDDVLQIEVAAHMEQVKSATLSIEHAVDTEQSGSKRRRTCTTTVDDAAEQRKATLEPHPLVVRFTIGLAKNANDYLVVNLRYFQRLNLVTASTVMNVNEADVNLGDVTSSHDILTNLYKQDSGDVIPFPASIFELSKIKMTAGEFLEYINSKEFGKPYRWLQRMCYLNSFNQVKGDNMEIKLQRIVPEAIKEIQKLWNSRLNLIKQIKALINKNTDCYLRDEKLPVAKPSCSLVLWTSVDWDEYASNANTATYIAAQLVKASQFFYRAVVVRGSAKMECLVSVSSQFPVLSPLWVICVYWNGEHNAGNNAAIKSMEFWTNSLRQSELNNPLGLLASQLTRTMYSFDIFLETEGPLYSPVEYNREKHFIKAFSKRLRARPYRYIEDGTVNSFKQ